MRDLNGVRVNVRRTLNDRQKLIYSNYEWQCYEPSLTRRAHGDVPAVARKFTSVWIRPNRSRVNLELLECEAQSIDKFD